MDDTKLLIFRSGSHKYGVPIEAVSAVIGITGGERPSVPAALPLIPLAGGCRKAGQALIILHIDGIQLALVVDKIIKVTSLATDANHAPKTAVGAFRFYRFPTARRHPDNPA